jgi:hypothetical protein
MNLKRLILSSILVALIAFIGVSYWEIAKPVPGPFTPFQEQMFRQGYARDHVTHRWYPSKDSWSKYGCTVYGTPLDATFSCVPSRDKQPLPAGIPDEVSK